jgi:hypothetical protein
MLTCATENVWHNIADRPTCMQRLEAAAVHWDALWGSPSTTADGDTQRPRGSVRETTRRRTEKDGGDQQSIGQAEARASQHGRARWEHESQLLGLVPQVLPREYGKGSSE